MSKESFIEQRARVRTAAYKFALKNKEDEEMAMKTALDEFGKVEKKQRVKFVEQIEATGTITKLK